MNEHEFKALFWLGIAQVCLTIAVLGLLVFR